MKNHLAALSIVLTGLTGCTQESVEQQSTALTDEQVENIIRSSYQYGAMYNVNNKFAMDPTNPLSSGGWNRVKANTQLADHTLQRSRHDC